MQKNTYSEEFKEQALVKVYSRKNRTIDEVAAELNMFKGTLKSWMRAASRTQKAAIPSAKRADDWTPAERLLALNETHAMDESGVASWCRERGLFAHQLSQWNSDFCAANPLKAAADTQQELRALKQKNLQLQSNINRKDKALAEAAALLVLQKKFQALWEAEEI